MQAQTQIKYVFKSHISIRTVALPWQELTWKQKLKRRWRNRIATSQVKSSHLYLYSAFNNTDCVKALNSIKLEDRVSVMYNNKIKHSIFS